MSHSPQVMMADEKTGKLTLAQAERALGEPAHKWAGRCYEIACAFVEHRLTDGVVVYGHWVGPVAVGTRFDRGAPFVQHGWVLLPDGRVMDPTRWVFEGREPYLYDGPADHYDEGGNEWRETFAGDAPAFDPSDPTFDLRELCRRSTWQWVVEQLGLQERRVVTLRQLIWLAHRSPARLGPYACDLYGALALMNMRALIPIDNLRRVERECGVKFTRVKAAV